MVIDTDHEFLQTLSKYCGHVSPKSLSEFLKCPLPEAREMCIHIVGYRILVVEEAEELAILKEDTYKALVEKAFQS